MRNDLGLRNYRAAVEEGMFEPQDTEERELRHAILECLDDFNWQFFHADEAIANEDRLRFADKVQARLYGTSKV